MRRSLRVPHRSWPAVDRAVDPAMLRASALPTAGGAEHAVIALDHVAGRVAEVV